MNLVATVIARNGLNVRSGPGVEYGIVGGLRYGATAIILDGANGWWRIGQGRYVCGAWVRVGRK